MNDYNKNKMSGDAKGVVIVALAVVLLLGLICWWGHENAHDNNIKSRVRWEACVRDHSPAECKVALS